MAPSTRPKNDALAHKIATLKLELAPLVPLPKGEPHPAFPKTLLDYHLLTEDELDSMAHYYHQSTPGFWTNWYPARMNWDKEFLAKSTSSTTAAADNKFMQYPGLSQHEQAWLNNLMSTVQELDQPTATTVETTTNPYAGMSDAARIGIKRRKVGKFIGLQGMETPFEEIVGRIQASFDRAVARSREEMRRNEELVLRRKKLG